MRTPGSLTFDTSVVRTDEYILLAETIVENGATVEEAAITISAIDDMLAIQRMECIANAVRFTPTGRLRKNVSMLDMISGRLDQLLVELGEIRPKKRPF